jgi:SAM-dependent methyltransferase
VQNRQRWQPGKFVSTKKGLRANPRKIGYGSRFIGNIQAIEYEKLIKEHASGLLLDLGAGDVPLYEVYRDLVIDNICVDWKYSLHGSDFLDLQVDLNKTIPFIDHCFDTVLATDLLEHISNPGQIWSEIGRLLKPQGKLIMAVPFYYMVHEEPYDYFRYTEFMLYEYCDQNGLEVVLLRPYGGVPEVVFDIFAKQVQSSKPLSLLNYYIGTLCIRSWLGRSYSAKTHRKIPLGYSLVAQKV